MIMYIPIPVMSTSRKEKEPSFWNCKKNRSPYAMDKIAPEITPQKASIFELRLI